MSWGGNGGSQVDCFDERELPQIKRELKEKYIYPQMTQMDVRKRTVEGNNFRLMMTDDE